MVFAHSIVQDAFSRPIVKLMAAFSGTNDTRTIQEMLIAKGPLEGDRLERRPLYIEASTPAEALKRVESRLKAGALSLSDMGKLRALVPIDRTTGMSSSDLVFLPY